MIHPKYFKLIKDDLEQIESKEFWVSVSRSFDPHLSQDCEFFIKNFSNKLIWYYLPYGKLSEDFIIKYQDKINWYRFSSNAKLSERLLSLFKDRLNWKIISRRCSLPEDLIEKFQDYVVWFNVFHYRNLSFEFKDKFKHKLTQEEIEKLYRV